MSPRFVLGRENVPCIAEVVNRSLKADCTDFTDHCIIGNIGTPSGNSHLIGCIGEIIGSYRSLTDKETSYIHKYFTKKWGVIDDPI